MVCYIIFTCSTIDNRDYAMSLSAVYHDTLYKANIYEFFLRQLILRALHDKLNMHVYRALASIMMLSRVPFLMCFLINIEFC